MQAVCFLAAMIVLGTDDALAEPQSTVDTVLQAWSQRAASVPCGEVRWSLADDATNRFGRFETEAVPRSREDTVALTGSVCFGGQEARYDGTTFNFAPVQRRLPGCERQVSDFELQLAFGFSDPQAVYRDPWTYSVLYQPLRRVHLWRGQGDDYSGAVILSAAPKPGELPLSQVTSDEGRLAEFHQALAAPILLTYRPTLLEPRFLHPDACHLAQGPPPIHAGRPCLVLDVSPEIDRQQNASESPPRHTYWIDPSRDFVVVRRITTRGETVVSQLDIQYETLDGAGWAPQLWTVLQFGAQPDIVERSAIATRTHCDLRTTIDASRWAIVIPAKSVVVDVPARRQYVIQSDRREKCIPGPLGTFLQEPRAIASSQWWVTFWRKARRIFVTLWTWPGVLLPVGICSGLLIALNRLQTRRPRKVDTSDFRDAAPQSAPEETATGEKSVSIPAQPDQP